MSSTRKTEVVFINYERIGIDLGSKWIKMTLIGQAPETLFAEQTAHYEAIGTFGSKRYVKSLKENLKDFIGECGLNRVSLSFTVAPRLEGYTTLNTLTLPTSDPKILKKAVKFEMEQQDIVDTISEFHHLWVTQQGSSEEDDEMAQDETPVVLATLKKNLLFELAQLRGLKCKIESVETQGSTAGRFVEGHAAVIDIGHQATRLYLYKDGKLKSFDTLELSGYGLTAAIQEKLGMVSKDNAENIKHKTSIHTDHSLVQQTDESVRLASEVTSEEYGFAVSEIKRIIRTFEIKEFVTLDRIYYTGGGALLTDFTTYLSKELGHDALPLSRSINAPTVPANTDTATTEHDAPVEPVIEDEFTDFLKASTVDELTEDATPTNESLISLEEVRAELADDARTDEADTIIEDEQPSRYAGLESDVPELYDFACVTGVFDEVEELPKLNFSRFLKYAFDFAPLLVAVLVGALALHAGVSAINNQYDDRLATVTQQANQQQNTLNDLQRQISDLESDQQSYERVSRMVDGLQGIKVWYSDLLYAIPDVTPAGVVVRQINIQDDSIVLNGYASDYTNVAVFAMGLEDYGDVDIDELEEYEEDSLYTTDQSDADTIHTEEAMTKTYRIVIENN